MAIYIELGTLLAMLFAVYLILRFLRDPGLVISNSILGIIVFFCTDFFFHPGVPINALSIAIVAVGGVPAVLLILLLHFLGIAF